VLVFVSAAAVLQPVTATRGASPQTMIFLDGEIGHPMLSGTERYFTPGSVATFDVGMLNGMVVIKVVVTAGEHIFGEEWNFLFGAPEGEPLVPGTYENAQSGPAPEGTPRLLAEMRNSTCPGPIGRFVVDELSVAADDSVEVFSARFESKCQDEIGKKLYGEIRVNSGVDVRAAIGEEPSTSPTVEVGKSGIFQWSVANIGTLPVTLGANAIISDPDNAFDLVGTECQSVTLQPGDECAISVRYTPKEAWFGSQAWLAMPDDTARGQRTVLLHGSGTPGPTPPKPPCHLALASATGTSQAGVAIVIGEILELIGWEWSSNQSLSILFQSTRGAEYVFGSSTNASGQFVEAFVFGPGSDQSWTVWVNQDGSGCERTPKLTVIPFTDVTADPFLGDIKWLYLANVTKGCTAQTFCPGGLVTREQMASFLARALHLPPATRDFFIDDETSIHEADINRVAQAGITTGCATRRYCPGGNVTREQMASFLARALRLPAASRDYFTDDESSIHEANINRMAEAGITSGCGPSRYCPTTHVTRGQMAAFLRRALQ
jgi:hypothetical protein